MGGLDRSPEMRRRYRRNSCRRIGAVRRKIGIYIHIIFSTLFSHVMSQRQARHTIIILTKQYSGMDIFAGNHYFAYGVWGVYANPSSFFIDLQGLTE